MTGRRSEEGLARPSFSFVGSSEVGVDGGLAM